MSGGPNPVNLMSSLPEATLHIKTRATAEGGGKKHHSYKPLPTQFRRGGFDYRQIYREDHFAIYRQTWKSNEHSAAFEVIRIRRREGREIAGKFIEPHEVYPNSEAWGTDSWTVLDKETAFRKLREIVSASEKESANPVKKSPIQNTKRCSETRDLRGDVKARRDG
jgi:hypothetical protein